MVWNIKRYNESGVFMSNSTKKPSKLSHKLVLGMLFLAILGFVLAFVLNTTLVRNTVYNNVLESIHREQKIQSRELEMWFLEAFGILEGLSMTVPLVFEENYQRIVEHFEQEYDFIEVVWLAFGDGEFYDSVSWDNPYEIDFTERAWWEQAAQQSGEVIITDPYISMVTGKTITTISYHIADLNRREAVVAMSIELEKIKNMVAEFQAQSEGSLLLIGGQGEIIVHPNIDYMPALARMGSEEEFRYVTDLLEYAPVLEAFVAGETIVTYDSYYFIQSPILSTGWILVSMLPNEVTSVLVWRTLTVVFLTIAGVLIAVALFTFFFLSHEIVKPVEVLTGDVKNLVSASSDVNATHFLENKRDDEVGTLTRAIGDMLIKIETITTQNQRIEFLEKVQELEQQSRIMLDLAPMSISIYDMNFNTIDCNKHSEELFISEDGDKIQSEKRSSTMPEFQPNGRNSMEYFGECAKTAIKEGMYTFELTCKTVQDKIIHAEITLVTAKYKNQDVLIEYGIDVTAKKEAYIKEQQSVALAQEYMAKEQEAITQLLEIERKLREHEAKNIEREMLAHQQQMYDANPFPSCLWGEGYALIDCNDAMIELLGANHKEEYMNEYEKFFAPEQFAGDIFSSMTVIKRETFAKGVFSYPWTYISKTGEHISGECTTVLINNVRQGSHQFLVYFHDMREVNALLAKLEKSVEKEKKANKAKSEFLSKMSHEIRTPMNAICGITELLLSNKHLTPEAVEGLVRIRSSSNLLLAIINDILDYSKVEAGKFELAVAEYDIVSIISDIVQLNTALCHENCEFFLSVDENIPRHFTGDEIRLKQIFNNLLSNAFKYTKEGMVSLDFRCESEPESSESDDIVTLVVEIKDTGRGMNEEQVNRLFSEFIRFNTAESPEIEGTGLGMVIARNFIHLMNGTIDVQSAPNVGTRVTVRIPQLLIEISDARRNAIIGRETTERLERFQFKCNSQAFLTHNEADNHMLTGKVLIVDDIESNLYVAKGLVKSLKPKLEIETLMSGEEAVENIRDGAVYDIIFMDHMMPEMDGIEAVAEIRKLGYKHPISALTANAIEGVKEMFLDNGFDDFVTKPINSQKLNETLNKFLLTSVIANNVKSTAPTEVMDVVESSVGDFEAGLREIFIRDAKKAIKNLETLMPVTKSTLKAYITVVHGIKTALYSIEEESLSQIGQLLVDAGRNDDLTTINAGTPEFLQRLKTVISKQG
ncbi:MAG: ATP-binding protein [Oscillospiraceae bacterium]|nr:ATP-binding protein [Oscillospiraceae bacterium]